MTPSLLDSHSVSSRENVPGSGALRPGDVCLYAPEAQRFFRDPVEIYSTSNLDVVVPLLNRIDARARGEGLYAVGYLAYEAAPAFDGALSAHDAAGPLLWFGLYDGFETALPAVADAVAAPADWKPVIGREQFDQTIERIRTYIAAGDTYQVNYTFPITAEFDGDPYAWFRTLCNAQRASYCAYIHAGDRHVLSFSPELFFSLDGEELVTQPMKGTIARGLSAEQDSARAQTLQESAKDRAENVMIVDMLRNDMGRISETGSVHVDSLFDVARYDTLWQMTSTIRSQTTAEVPEIFGALFPSGSITGAPKIRTSEIIHELETGPRGAYCGAIGWWGPERQAEFNVAIRTATIEVDAGRVTYPVGAGITWESSAAAEYDECLLKAEIVTKPHPGFELLESLLWDGEFFLLERHMNRVRLSADYFEFSFDSASVRDALDVAVRSLKHVPTKVRLTLSREGNVLCDCAPVGESRAWRVGIAPVAVDSGDVYLYHKTTKRDMYESALAGRDTDDAILLNERGEVTESTRANVIALIDDQWVTPPVACGLLAGTYREELLERGEIVERVVTFDDLKRAAKVELINSVRRRIAVELNWGDSE